MQTPAQNLVAAGSSVCSGAHILPPNQNVFGTYGPMRGGLMDLCIAVPVGELPAAPVFRSAPGSPPPSILFMMGDPEPKCNEFIPSALVWLLGPCPLLLPGNIASSYTTRGAQPLRYHANFQTDLITTTSRSRMQRWGRPPPRRVFKEIQKPQKQQLALHQPLNSFPHRKNESQVVCLTCTMHCVVSLLFQLCRLCNGSGK